MTKHVNNRRLQSACIGALFFVVANTIAVSGYYAAEKRGMIEETFRNAAQQIERARFLVNQHEFTTDASYPPGLVLMYAGLISLGIDQPNPVIIRWILINASLLVIFALARKTLRDTRVRYLTILAFLLNPCFIWTGVVCDDFIFEFFGLGIFLYCACCSLTHPKKLYVCLVMLAAFIAPLFRITSFFTIGLSLIFMAGKKILRGSLVVCIFLFALYVLAFMKYNESKTGIFTICTTGPINLWLGNHPQYVFGHPLYDIDLFLEKKFTASPRTYAEMQRGAIDFIRSDYMGFFYRITVKSVWHWFNFEKIPNLTATAYIEKNADRIVITKTAGLGHLATYILYKILYIPLFIVTLLGFFKRKDRLGFLFILPYIALWPIVALSFPETRFKLTAELFALLAMARFAECSLRGSCIKNSTITAGRKAEDQPAE